MKNCPVCNAQLNDEAAFCTQCGTPLRDGQGPEAQAAPQSEGNPAPGAAPQAAYQPPQQNPAQPRRMSTHMTTRRNFPPRIFPITRSLPC